MDQVDATGAPVGLTAGRIKAMALRQWWVVVLCGIVAAAAAAIYAEKRSVDYVADLVVNTGTPPVTQNQSSPSFTLPDPLNEVGSSQVFDAATTAAGTSNVHVTGALTGDGTGVQVQVKALGASRAEKAVEAAAQAFVKVRVRDINAQAAALNPQLATLNSELIRLDREAAAATRHATRTGGTSSSGSTSSPTALSTELSVLSGQYSALYSQQLQLQLTAQSVQLDQSSPLQVSAIGASKKEIVAIALGVGLLAGCGLGLLRDLARDRLTSTSELLELSHVPLLAEVPDSPRLRRKETVIDAFGGRFGEAIRELRTSVSLAPGGRPVKVLLVTSAASGEGKSYLAANLAVAYALAGARTTLVSSDLRQPAVEQLLGVPTVPQGGLTRLLRGGPAGIPRHTSNPRQAAEDTPSAELGAFLVRTRLEGLAVMPSGTLPSNPAELIASQAMAQLVELLRGRNDVVILDSPPLLAVTDAVLLSRYADATVFVVARGHSLKSHVRRALSTLERANAPLAGYVLNRGTRSGLVPYRYISPANHLNGSAAPVRAGTRAT